LALAPVVATVEPVLQGVAQALTGVATAVEPVLEAALPLVEATVTPVVGIVEPLLEAPAPILEAVTEPILHAAEPVLQSLASAVEPAVQTVRSTVTGIIDPVLQTVTNAATSLTVQDPASSGLPELPLPDLLMPATQELPSASPSNDAGVSQSPSTLREIPIAAYVEEPAGQPATSAAHTGDRSADYGPAGSAGPSNSGPVRPVPTVAPGTSDAGAVTLMGAASAIRMPLPNDSSGEVGGVSWTPVGVFMHFAMSAFTTGSHGFSFGERSDAVFLSMVLSAVTLWSGLILTRELRRNYGLAWTIFIPPR
jgi:hypothetical protein